MMFMWQKHNETHLKRAPHGIYPLGSKSKRQRELTRWRVYSDRRFRTHDL